MGTDGFQRISIVRQTELFKWGDIGPFAHVSKLIEHYQYHCICCGVIIEEEIKHNV